ncbi:MAG TPA: hypothetical protein VN541_03775 [Tepidisphaeraceae bacterium]|nr:hypothetical protein [Tepidisphaeraceae bacterium]
MSRVPKNNDDDDLEFDEGELQRLLAEGEQSIKEEGTIDADEAFLARRQRRKGPPTGPEKSSK